MEINKPLLKSLLIMADVIEARDPYTGGHVWRVSQFSKLLATKAGLPEDEVIKISIACFTGEFQVSSLHSWHSTFQYFHETLGDYCSRMDVRKSILVGRSFE